MATTADQIPSSPITTASSSPAKVTLSLFSPSPIAAASSSSPAEADEKAISTPPKEDISTSFKDFNESKAQLLARVQSLKKDLKEWRGKLDNQVQTYRQELGELRSTLDVEIEQLKTDFQGLRLSLKNQLDVTTDLYDKVVQLTVNIMSCTGGNAAQLGAIGSGGMPAQPHLPQLMMFPQFAMWKL